MDRSAKATPQKTRTHNRLLVLGTIYRHHRTSRAAVAHETGLTRTTVSELVSGLIADDLVREVGRGASTGGKMPILVEVDENGRHVLGIDIAGDSIHGAIVNLRGRMLHRIVLPAASSGRKGSADNVADLVARLLAVAHRPILGVGVGAPGLVDSARGIVRLSAYLDWRTLPLGPALQEAFGLPVAVTNNSQAAALARYAFGRPRPENLVVVRVSEGIGAGLILNGELFRGDASGAGEIGHFGLPGQDAECVCGSRGCVETVASSGAILERANRSRAGGHRLATMNEVAATATDDPAVRAVVEEAGAALGLALAGLVSAVNVASIVLVGTVTALGAPWLEAVTRSVAAHALSLLTRETRIEIGEAATEDVVLGASALVLTRELGLLLLPDPAGAAVDFRTASRPLTTRAMEVPLIAPSV